MTAPTPILTPVPTSVTTMDGSTIPGVISGLTVHTWTADVSGAYHTGSLAAEWKASEATMLAGAGATLAPLQRMEANAESIIDNTAAATLSTVQQQYLREDIQREYDAIAAAQAMNQVTYGIDPAKQYTADSYLRMEQTLQNNETLKTLGLEGHGLNRPPSPMYRGYTSDFQNVTDNKTYYVGGGPGSGEHAIPDFLDDDVLTHAPFPIVERNGVLTQLDQNGNLADSLNEVLTAANQAEYTRVYVAADFSQSQTATGPVVWVAGTPAPATATPTVDQTLQPDYIVFTSPNYGDTGSNPATWFQTAGWQAGANPNPWFDTNYYLAQNPDVKASGMDPLMHFETFGWKEARDPSLVFSDAKYLAANPDVRAAGIDPVLHYLQNGAQEGRMTFLSGGAAPADPLVSASFYDPQLGATLVPTGAAAAQQAAYSYDAGGGWQKGLNPDAFFNTAYYLAHNPDVARAHIDPLAHFEAFGWQEGRNASATFSTAKYLAANADVKAAGIDPLVHFLQYGQAEGRMAFAA